MRAFEVALATAGSTVALAWQGDEAGHSRIFFEWLAPDGGAGSRPSPITDGARDAYEPDLALAGGEPVLAWYEKDAHGVRTAWLAGLSATGRLLWRASLSAAGEDARNPVVKVQRGVVYVAWIETPSNPTAPPQVWTQRFDLEGRPFTGPVRAGEASRNTWNLNAALDAGGVLYVVYDARLGVRAKELRLAIVGLDTVRNVPLTQDDGAASVYPDLKINSRGVAALTWFDRRDGNDEVYLIVAPVAALASGSAAPARRITHTETPSVGAYLEWNGDVLALVWCDSDQGPSELYGQVFSGDGRSTAGPRRLTRHSFHASIPSVRPWGRGFLVAWNDYVAEGGGGAGHRQIRSSVARTLRFGPKS
jgi:hypothetical protein